MLKVRSVLMFRALSELKKVYYALIAIWRWICDANIKLYQSANHALKVT